MKKTALTLVTLLALAGCSNSAAEAETPELTVTDAWTKAADTGMTAAFGVITNPADADVHIVSATSDVTSSMELHEMFTDDAGVMAMRQKEDGFTIPAGGTHELSPGGDHLMFMDLTTPVLPGDDVVITLTAEDGATFEFTAPGRSYSGANESYHADSEMEMG